MLDLNHSQLMNQSQQVMNNNQNSQITMMNMNQSMNPNTHMMTNNNRCGGYRMWPPEYKNTKLSGYIPSSNPRNNKNRRNQSNRKELPVNRKELPVSLGGYNQPTVNELPQQNRLKPKPYISKKKFNQFGKSAPFAPRNTTSFLIRAKKSGGITSITSPMPVTPAVLATPSFSPSSEVLGDTAKEEWGVDGYGSMKGLIRLRSCGNDDEECDYDRGSSESDVEDQDQEQEREHVKMERRLDHDLSRFEMVYPNYIGCDHGSYVLENRVDDQDTHIARLEDESLMLKDRLFFMEREFDKLRTRLQCLETGKGGSRGLVVENDSENDSGGYGIGRLIDETSKVLEENKNSVVDNQGYENDGKGVDESKRLKIIM